MPKIKITNPRNVIEAPIKKNYFKIRATSGPKGDKGDTGATGPQGPQGPQGNAATIYVGSTTTLPVGQDATVENVGSRYAAVLNFGIPQGPQGPQGAKGDKGDKGDKGEQGNTGNTGPAGQNATVYIGTTTTSAPGSQASVYNSGTENNAVLNFTIPRGQKGDTGATGATGATGPAGQDGKDFAPSVVDSLPAVGEESKLYLTPKAHTTQTATGNPISATVTDDAGQIEDFQLDGDTYQQSYSGKNLLNCVQRSGASQGITCVVSNTNTLTITGKSTTSYADLTDRVYTNITAGTFTFVVSQALTHRLTVRVYYEGGYNNAIIEPGDTYKTFTMESDITGFYVYMATGGTGITFNETFTVQIVAGSMPDTDFEPYTGGIASPNPDYPQTIQTVTGEQTVKVVGKNLLNVKDNLKTSASGLDFSFSDNKLVVSGTPTATYANVTNEIDVDLPAGNYTFSISNAINHRVYIRVYYEDSTYADTFLINAGSTSKTGSLAKKVERIRIDFSTMTIGTAINESFALQLEKGSTVTTYEPYSSNDYEINLGKNLFDKSKQVGGWLNDTGGIQQPTSVADKTSDYMACSPNTSYTLSSPGYYLKIAQYDASKTFIKLDQSGNNIPSLTVNTAENAAYIRISYGNAQQEPNVQFEAGSVASTYAPYFEPIELCKLGNYQDYIYKDGDTWKVHKATFKHQFDGIGDNWNYASSTHALQDQNFSVVQTGAVKFDVPGVALSREFTYFPNPGGITTLLPDGCFGFQTTGQYYATFKNDAAFTSKEAAIAWLRTNKPTAYWALATPTDTTITDQTLIAQLEAIRTASLENGSNTITNTATGSNLAGDMEVDYFGYDPTNRYDKWLWLDINNAYEKLGS